MKFPVDFTKLGPIFSIEPEFSMWEHPTFCGLAWSMGLLEKTYDQQLAQSGWVAIANQYLD